MTFSPEGDRSTMNYREIRINSSGTQFEPDGEPAKRLIFSHRKVTDCPFRSWAIASISDLTGRILADMNSFGVLSEMYALSQKSLFTPVMRRASSWSSAALAACGESADNSRLLFEKQKQERWRYTSAGVVHFGRAGYASNTTAISKSSPSARAVWSLNPMMVTSARLRQRCWHRGCS